MKQIYIFTAILFLTIINSNAQTTFDWDTAPIDNGNNVTESISGITATFVGGTSTTGFINALGFGGSSDNVVINSTDGTQLTTSITFNFSQSVDIVSILALEGNGASVNYTFTPIGGTNSTVQSSLVSGSAQVNLNWTGVNSFTVSASSASRFAFDNLILTSSTLSTNNFTLKTIKVYPNPSSDFIKIDGLKTVEKFCIFNILSEEVIKGIVSNNDKIDIQNLTNGLYFLKFDNGSIFKFLKN